MSSEAVRLHRWRTVTIATLFTGYAGYYLCRSNLSVATPLILEEYGSQGLTKEHIGHVASLGTFFYAAGKLLNGMAAEYVGGRGIFLLGIFASVTCTVLLAFSPLFSGPLSGSAAALQLPAAILLPFLVLWSANRFVQSMGWGGLVQISARWFEHRWLATVMGILTMSYLLGDVAARLYLGAIIRAGVGWQGVFFIAAGTLGLIGIVALFTLKSRPGVLGLPEPPPPPGNVFGADRGERPVSVFKILLPLASSFAFWVVCLMNVGLTVIRETFLFWSPTYLVEVVKLDAGSAGIASLVFPLAGAVSALLAGWFVDLTGGRFGPVVVPLLLSLVIVLLALVLIPIDAQEDPVLALSLIGAAAFFLLAPYTFCSGVMAVKFGGQRAGATAAGIIDTAGYLGGVFAGTGIAWIAQNHGWQVVFGTLAGIAAFTALVSLGYWVMEARTRRQTSEV